MPQTYGMGTTEEPEASHTLNLGEGFTSHYTEATPTQPTDADVSQMMAMLQRLSLDVQALKSSQGSNPMPSGSAGSTATDAITMMTGLMS